jgi:hypothetical protein
MGMKTNPRGAVRASQNAPLYGMVVFNLVEESPAGVAAVLDGDTSMGQPVGFLTGAPTFNVSRETVNITEPIMGLGVRLKGSEQLQNEEGTVELEFANISVDNLLRALPGTRRSDWLSVAHASVTLGSGNAAFKLAALEGGVGPNTNYTAVIATPAGSTTTVAVTGSLPSRVITITPATGATANDVIKAVNANSQANAIVQAGRTNASDGTGTVAAVTSTPFSGGAAGTKIGERLTSPGSWALSDYVRTVHIVWESTATNVAMMARIKNAISMDDFSFQADDGGQMSGIGMTLTATADEEDYVAATGSYTGPFAIMKLDDVAA